MISRRSMFARLVNSVGDLLFPTLEAFVGLRSHFKRDK